MNQEGLKGALFILQKQNVAWFFRKAGTGWKRFAGLGVQGIVMATRGKPHEVGNSQAQVRGSRKPVWRG